MARTVKNKKVQAKKQAADKKEQKRRSKEERPVEAKKEVNRGFGASSKEKDEQIHRIIYQSFLGTYLKMDTVTDINYDGHKVQLLDNMVGPIRPKEQPTQDDVKRLLNQIANVQGRQLNTSNPIMDTEIGFLRVNAVDSSASPDGITFSIRVSRPRLAIPDISNMTVGGRPEVSDLLNSLVKAQSNIIISGETGSGKTELQKYLVGYTEDDDLIIVIEDTRDSHIKALYPEKNIKSWQTLTSEDRERKYGISDFVKAGLRNFPDWMIVSETRGEEAGDMLDSAKTGHPIITTLHATSAIDIPSRLMSMIRQAAAYRQVTDMVVGQEITKFLRFGIHLASVSEKTPEGTRIVRRIKEIVEYTGYSPEGPMGNYLYRAVNQYNESIGDYEMVEEFGALSETTIHAMKDKRIYHMLPDLFKPEYNAHNPAGHVSAVQAVQQQAVRPQTVGGRAVSTPVAAVAEPVVASTVVSVDKSLEQVKAQPVRTVEQGAIQTDVAELKKTSKPTAVKKEQSVKQAQPVSVDSLKFQQLKAKLPRMEQAAADVAADVPVINPHEALAKRKEALRRERVF